MEESLPPMPPVAPEPPAPATSLFERLTNVFVAPGEVFDEVKSSRSSVANWLVPVILSALVGVASVFVIFSQDNIVQQVREQQELALEKQLAHMPKAQREKVIAASQKFLG